MKVQGRSNINKVKYLMRTQYLGTHCHLSLVWEQNEENGNVEIRSGKPPNVEFCMFYSIFILL